MNLGSDLRELLKKIRDSELSFDEGLAALKVLMGDLLPESELFSAVDDASTKHASVQIIHLDLMRQWREAQHKQPDMIGPKRASSEGSKRAKKLACVTVLAFALSGAPIHNHTNSSGAATPLSIPALLFMV